METHKKGAVAASSASGLCLAGQSGVRAQWLDSAALQLEESASTICICLEMIYQSTDRDAPQKQTPLIHDMAPVGSRAPV